jgi:hypothetical protein
MNSHPHAATKPWQFSLGAMFIAVAFVALTCAALKCFITAACDPGSLTNPAREVLAFFGIPIGLCGTLGALRGRLVQWLWCGVGIDIVVMGLILLTLLAR